MAAPRWLPNCQTALRGAIRRSARLGFLVCLGNTPAKFPGRPSDIGLCTLNIVRWLPLWWRSGLAEIHNFDRNGIPDFQITLRPMQILAAGIIESAQGQLTRGHICTLNTAANGADNAAGTF